jgi:beta-phosphoglucomutase-like phosphatase (HAD superfamily)
VNTSPYPVALEAVVFDLDGVLLHSETVWDDARRALVRDAGGHWTVGATTEMIGMSSLEWSRYLQERLGVPLSPRPISARVAQLVIDTYVKNLPLVPGAIDAVHAIAAQYGLGLASSSNRLVIEAFLGMSGLRDCFAVTISSEEVLRAKPRLTSISKRCDVSVRRPHAPSPSRIGVTVCARRTQRGWS